MITSFTIILFAASLIVGFSASSAWRRRKVTGGVALTLTLIAIAIWCFFSGMETTSNNESLRYFWAAMSYIGVCNVTPLFVVFAAQYSDSRWRLSTWLLVIFWSIPVATLALAFTNSYHHLIWTGVTLGPISGTNTVVYHHGPWYWVETAWFLGLTLVACYHLLRVAIRAVRLYILQALILLVSIIIPWVGLLLFLLPNDPFAGLETTCLGFAISAILLLFAMGRMRFLDIVPQARATLMENMHEGFLVLDPADRVADINKAACRLLNIDSSVVGRNLADTFPSLREGLSQTAKAETLVLSPPHDTKQTLEVSVSHLASRVGKKTGRILLIRDISERRHTETEKEKLILDLQDALENVKRLRGLLPICASCKKIRDDKGYWHQVENYMHDHAEVEFSHGICPDCIAKFYPELQESGNAQQT